MSGEPKRDELSERAAQRLARIAPAELSAQQSRELIRRAVRTEPRRRAESGGGLLLLVAATAGALALALALAIVSPPTLHPPAMGAPVSSVAVATEPSRLSLPTGDQLVAAQGAAFEVRSAEAQRREVALRRGQMLFDVARLGEGQRFEVVTPDARVSVLGTVFTVEAIDGRTVVRVYEGEVRVERAGRSVRLGVGQHFVSDDRHPSRDPLMAQALAAAERRRAAPAAALAKVTVEVAVPVIAAAPPAAEAAPPVTAAAPRVAVPTELSDARRRLREGRLQLALAAAAGAIDRRQEPLGQWYLLCADALVAEGRLRPAGAALESAAVYLQGSEARDAAYRAALTYSEQLHDPARALHVLRASGVLGPEKFGQARGMELWVRLLVSLERRWEASAVARRYLRTYPDSSEASAMRSVADYGAPNPMAQVN